MNAPLPGPLQDNPRLDRWLAFPSPGQVTVLTGRVELGQGVLTAMAQIAADALDVSLARITVRSGDTAATPNEGYTAGSQSIQSGAMALRQACAEVRALFMAAAAKKLGCNASALTIRDGAVLRDGAATGEDYWTLAPRVNLAVEANGSGTPTSDFKIVGTSTARLDLPDKIFGAPAFIHDMRLPGMRHARVVRQPSRHAAIETVDEAAIKRAAKAPVDFVRNGNFLAIVGDDETAVERAAVAALNAVRWSNVEQPAASQQEATWLLQRPMVDIRFGAPEAPPAAGTERFEATYSRGYLAHASISPSCGLALFENGHLTVWTHCQGVSPPAWRARAHAQARARADHGAARSRQRLLRP